MVLVLRDQRIFMLAIDDPLPQRPDQMKPVVSTMVQPEALSFAVALSVISFSFGCAHTVVPAKVDP